MKLFDIKTDNTTTEPFEYLLIKNFAPLIEDEFLFKDYVVNYIVKNDYPEMHSTSGHPIEDQLQQNKQSIIARVNLMWNLKVADIYISMNSFNKKGHGLKPHNDFHEVNRIPVRGILYCNPDKKFGTQIHLGEYEPVLKEIGGGPGDLLLIKVTENSWHSTVKVESDMEDRLTCNMFFVNDIEQTEFSANK